MLECLRQFLGMTSQNKIKYITAGLLIVFAISPGSWALVAFTSMSIVETDALTLMLFAVSVSAPLIFNKMLFSYELFSLFSPKDQQRNELALLFSLLLTGVISHGLIIISYYCDWGWRELVGLTLTSESILLTTTIVLFFAGWIKRKCLKGGGGGD